MELILKQYDIPLLRFSATNDSSTPEIKVHWINKDQRHLLPLDMELSPEGISRWMRRRTIPRNRLCQSASGKMRIERQPPDGDSRALQRAFRG